MYATSDRIEQRGLNSTGWSPLSVGHLYTSISPSFQKNRFLQWLVLPLPETSSRSIEASLFPLSFVSEYTYRSNISLEAFFRILSLGFLPLPIQLGYICPRITLDSVCHSGLPWMVMLHLLPDPVACHSSAI